MSHPPMPSPQASAPAHAPRALIAGGGIGGLAAAWAVAQCGWQVAVHEQASAWSELGAGVQLGPNVTRRLHRWGLLQPLMQVAMQPQALVVRSAAHAGELARRPLQAAADASAMPYLTVHRAALHRVLLEAARAAPGVTLHAHSRVRSVGLAPGGADARLTVELGAAGAAGAAVQAVYADADLLVVADGLWSQLRSVVVDHDAPPRPTGHLAYRALVPQADLPASLRSSDVTVWLGRRLHVVHYPVLDPQHGALALNVVLVVHAQNVPEDALPAAQAMRWDHSVHPGEWQAAVRQAHPSLQRLLDAMPGWQRWSLHDRAPLRSAAQMARGRVALLGDAAHPMRPYLAQGAGMAIEDAFELGRCLGTDGRQIAQQLQHYAQARWARNARVQSRSMRNGRIFHAGGLVRLGRDAALRLLGARLLDQRWLYRG